MLASCRAKWQQHSGRDRTIKHCNALLFLSLCLKGNVTVTNHFTILSILKVKEDSVVQHTHTAILLLVDNGPKLLCNLTSYKAWLGFRLCEISCTCYVQL